MADNNNATPPAGEQAPNPGLSLADLDRMAAEGDTGTTPAAAAVQPLGDGNPKPLPGAADTPPAGQAAATPGEAAKDPAKPAGEEGAKAPEEEEGDEGDGSDEGQAGDEEDAFWERVNQITGEPVEVDYGETDPLSPEGVGMREMQVRRDAQQKFEDYLRRTDPRGYAYLIHRENGGTDEEFFAEPSFTLPEKSVFEESIEAQTGLVKRALLAKGVPEDVVDATVQKYVKDNMLKDRALAIYDEQRKLEEQQVKQLEETQKKQQALIQESVMKVTTSLANTINDGSLKLIIPEAKKAEFNEYLKENLRMDNGKFYIVTELDKEGKNLREIIEAQYFQFVKGDLNAIVQKKAKTLTAQRLRTTVKKATELGTKGAQGETGRSEYIPLGEI